MEFFNSYGFRARIRRLITITYLLGENAPCQPPSFTHHHTRRHSDTTRNNTIHKQLYIDYSNDRFILRPIHSIVGEKK